jgi:predicted DsbA family dithiol-disulfide isomerase
MNISEAKARIKQVAEELGLPLGERARTYNSRLAQELGKWAETQGKGDEFHNAVFRAYFAQGANIGKTPELIALAESVGLPGKEAGKVLESRGFRESVDLDWARSRQMGVTAVPTFVIDSRGVVGAQSYEVLEQLMRVSNVKKRHGDS